MTHFDASKNASARGLARREMIPHNVYYVGESVPVKITINEQLSSHRAKACEWAVKWAAGQINTNSFWNNSLNLAGGGFTTNPRIHLQVLHDNNQSYGRTSLWAELNDGELIEVYACPKNSRKVILHALQKPNGLQLEVLIDLNPRYMTLAGVDTEILAMATIVHEWFIHAIQFIRTARSALVYPHQHAIGVVHGKVELKCPNGKYETNEPREKREHDWWMEFYLAGDKEEQERRAKGLFDKMNIHPGIRGAFKRAFEHDLYLMKHGTAHAPREEASPTPSSKGASPSGASKPSKRPRAESPSSSRAAEARVALRAASLSSSRVKESQVAPRTETSPAASYGSLSQQIERMAPAVFKRINDALGDDPDVNFPAKEFRFELQRLLGVALNPYKTQINALANRLADELPDD